MNKEYAKVMEVNSMNSVNKQKVLICGIFR